jgi:hypothetical protein
MLDKIKNIIKDIQPTTWILIAVGVLAAIVLIAVSQHAPTVPAEVVK